MGERRAQRLRSRPTKPPLTRPNAGITCCSLLVGCRGCIGGLSGHRDAYAPWVVAVAHLARLPRLRPQRSPANTAGETLRVAPAGLWPRWNPSAPLLGTQADESKSRAEMQPISRLFTSVARPSREESRVFSALRAHRSPRGFGPSAPAPADRRAGRRPSSGAPRASGRIGRGGRASPQPTSPVPAVGVFLLATS